MEAENSIIGVEVGQSSQSTGTLYYYLTSIRDLLLVIYRGNEEQLSTWGFNVAVSSHRKQTSIPLVEEM